MKVETAQYEKQYGYSYHTRVTCSCGYDSGMASHDAITCIKAHQLAAVYNALGLKFSVER